MELLKIDQFKINFSEFLNSKKKEFVEKKNIHIYYII